MGSGFDHPLATRRCFGYGRTEGRMSKQKINATHYEDIPVYGNGAKRAEHRVNAIIETPKIAGTNMP